ncbi:deoxyribonuclease-1-like [Hydractinia symbiolongicarpus]|uniref:deoxyribonuclease-1-like n=1 Tax=Hydractinia symbiolongicarpus TaxID=13093 RepID=UPI00254F1521|nr:deoxyribonuclease-1-like [Hydractinia symbiolongicarpus]
MDVRFAPLLFLLSCAVFCVSAYNDRGVLDVASFNVQIFGVKKMKNPVVRKYLTKIILQFDLVLIQEIRDSTGTAILDLLKQLNKVEPKYKVMVSDRLGRSTSKEQYAFIYRSDWLTPVSSFTYDDKNDVFAREPYVVHFKSKKAEIQDFAVAGIHTAPKDAENEISNLTLVYNNIVQKLKTQNAIIMGDFNAEYHYTKHWRRIKLATDPRFYWLIDNTFDTTTKTTDCSYDRIVVTGDSLLKAIIPLSASVFRFDEKYKLTQKTTQLISDHFPVRLQIRSAEEKHNIQSSIAMKVYNNKLSLSRLQILNIKKSAMRKGKYKIEATSKGNGGFVIKKSATGTKKVILCLFQDFYKMFSNMITKIEISTAIRMVNQLDFRRYLPRGHGLFKTLYDFYKDSNIKYEVKLSCNVSAHPAPYCYLEIVQFGGNNIVS